MCKRGESLVSDSEKKKGRRERTYKTRHSQNSRGKLCLPPDSRVGRSVKYCSLVETNLLTRRKTSHPNSSWNGQVPKGESEKIPSGNYNVKDKVIECSSSSTIGRVPVARL